MINGKSVSLCMVIYQQVELTAKAIESVRRIIDEIVIVDQGSDKQNADKLKELANVYHFTTNKGNADFDRTFCYSLASKEFILALDADEFLTEEMVERLEKLVGKYEFDVVWFLFDNTINHNGIKVDLKKYLSDDPHPRFWRKLISKDGQQISPLNWPPDAHQFPAILTERQVFAEIHFTHARELVDVITTHLRRGKNIGEEAQQVEKNFVRTILEEFGNDVKLQMKSQFPELREYLK